MPQNKQEEADVTAASWSAPQSTPKVKVGSTPKESNNAGMHVYPYSEYALLDGFSWQKSAFWSELRSGSAEGITLKFENSYAFISKVCWMDATDSWSPILEPIVVALNML